MAFTESWIGAALRGSGEKYRTAHDRWFERSIRPKLVASTKRALTYVKTRSVTRPGLAGTGSRAFVHDLACGKEVTDLPPARRLVSRELVHAGVEHGRRRVRERRRRRSAILDHQRATRRERGCL